MNRPQSQRLLAFVKHKGVVRPRDLAAIAVDRKTLARACERGLVERCGRGMYRLPDAVGDPQLALVIACKRVPHAIVCLLSALAFHGLTSKTPAEVWIAIDGKARLPHVDFPRLRVVRFSGAVLREGVMNVNVAGVAARVYSPMKTVADCFKYRSKIGIKACVHALKAAIQQNKYNRKKLMRFAGVCGVTQLVAAYADDTEQIVGGGRKQTVKNSVAVWDRDVLSQQVWSMPLRQLARKYGVSDVALARRCRKLNIPLPGRGYWARKSHQAQAAAEN